MSALQPGDRHPPAPDPLDDLMARHRAPRPGSDFADRVLAAWQREEVLVPSGTTPGPLNRLRWAAVGFAAAALVLLASRLPWFGSAEPSSDPNHPPAASSRGDRPSEASPSPAPRIVTGAIGMAGFAPAAVIEPWPPIHPPPQVEPFDDLRPEDLSWR